LFFEQDFFLHEEHEEGLMKIHEGIFLILNLHVLHDLHVYQIVVRSVSAVGFAF